jgi:hypothetical protein
MRVCKAPLLDDETGVMAPGGSLISVEKNRAKYLMGMGKLAMPGDDVKLNPEIERKPKKGLQEIETDAEAETQAEATS